MEDWAEIRRWGGGGHGDLAVVASSWVLARRGQGESAEHQIELALRWRRPGRLLAGRISRGLGSRRTPIELALRRY